MARAKANLTLQGHQVLCELCDQPIRNPPADCQTFICPVCDNGGFCRACAHPLLGHACTKIVGDLRAFKMRDLDAALAHAAAGGQALHLHRIVFSNSPLCFRRAIQRGQDIAHLFDQHEDRLIYLARKLGVRVLKLERPGTPRQHIDLCGRPLVRALELTKET